MTATDPRNPQPDDPRHPAPAQHNDNAHSKMPKRDDRDRKQSPADRPGKHPGEGEPSVS
ncbi:hypothetical protein [Paraburkholderia tropica]|uniref:Uncharacterized protein n=1 Tax=Paraburkholderia tropica TaxID=92647 RepID=A0AAQ1GF45_9BURK|nr:MULTISPECIES: hypothetical protein [Paraburkholderia]SEJ59810.1 hypothetical protein SAMN05216550_106160 [Paraburkholderia tropica]